MHEILLVPIDTILYPILAQMHLPLSKNALDMPSQLFLFK